MERRDVVVVVIVMGWVAAMGEKAMEYGEMRPTMMMPTCSARRARVFMVLIRWR